MGWGTSPYGSVPWGSQLILDLQSSITFVKKTPEPSSQDNEPDQAVSVSIRDAVAQITYYLITINGQPAIISGVIQPGFKGSVTPNAFRGFDAWVKPTNEFPLGQTGDSPHQATIEATDALGLSNNASWNFYIRKAIYDDLRFALPLETQRADPVTMNYLTVWDGISALILQSTLDKITNRQNIDPDTIPEEALPTAFESAGIILPSFDEISVERQRRILRNADAIHRSRYSIQGLQFYISLLVDATVQVLRLNRGFFLFLNSEAFGLPTPEMMNSSQTNNDICTYLVGPRSEEIIVRVTGKLSDKMKSFLRETIFREIPFADDPVNPLNITIEFLEELD